MYLKFQDFHTALSSIRKTLLKDYECDQINIRFGKNYQAIGLMGIMKGYDGNEYITIDFDNHSLSYISDVYIGKFIPTYMSLLEAIKEIENHNPAFFTNDINIITRVQYVTGHISGFDLKINDANNSKDSKVTIIVNFLFNKR